MPNYAHKFLRIPITATSTSKWHVKGTTSGAYLFLLWQKPPSTTEILAFTYLYCQGDWWPSLSLYFELPVSNIPDLPFASSLLLIASFACLLRSSLDQTYSCRHAGRCFLYSLAVYISIRCACTVLSRIFHLFTSPDSLKEVTRNLLCEGRQPRCLFTKDTACEGAIMNLILFVIRNNAYFL